VKKVNNGTQILDDPGTETKLEFIDPDEQRIAKLTQVDPNYVESLANPWTSMANASHESMKNRKAFLDRLRDQVITDDNLKLEDVQKLSLVRGFKKSDSPDKIEAASGKQEDSKSNNDSDFNPEKLEEVQDETLNYEEEKGKIESDPQTQNLDITNKANNSLNIDQKFQEDENSKQESELNAGLDYLEENAKANLEEIEEINKENIEELDKQLQERK